MRCLLVLIIALFLSFFVSAEFYADLDISVDETGFVKISGLSNHDVIKSGSYDFFTSKDGSHWVLNISSSDVFESYLYDLKLPENSVVNYVGAYDIDSFEGKEGLRLKGVVQDKPFKLIVQYKLNKINRNMVWAYVLSGVVLGLVLILIFYMIFRRGLPKNNKVVFDKQIFTDREYQILMLIQKNKGYISQSKLQSLTNLPKASLSRNVASLVRKEIVVKYKTGMTNMIKLK